MNHKIYKIITFYAVIFTQSINSEFSLYNKLFTQNPYLDINTLSFSLNETVLNKEELKELAETLKKNPTLDEADHYARKLGKRPFCDQNQLEKFLYHHTETINAFLTTFSFFSAISLIGYIQFKIFNNSIKSDSFKIYKPGEINDNFSSVIGNNEAKNTLKSIVHTINCHKKNEGLKDTRLQGVLLTGAPGTGKTFLARALAGEANCPFMYASGSDFNSKWVGSGTEKIKALFSSARKLAASSSTKSCIIFIDEVEVLATRRGYSFDNYSDQTVNQLLTELDGFIQNEHQIIFIAATNFPEKIDPALLRPGRINKIIEIEPLTLEERILIFKTNLEKLSYSQNIDLHLIAKQTTGFTPADLTEIIYNALDFANKRNSLVIEQADLENAFELQTIGSKNKIPLSKKERSIVAYHEAGHALISILLNGLENIYKVTILPRGNSLGATLFVKKEETERLQTKEKLLDQICICLAGRAAEDIIFKCISTTCSNDLEKATDIAERMVKYYGMGDKLMVTTHTNKISNPIIDKEIDTLLSQEYQRIKDILLKNIDKLHRLAQELLKKEVLYQQDIVNLNII